MLERLALYIAAAFVCCSCKLLQRQYTSKFIRSCEVLVEFHEPLAIAVERERFVFEPLSRSKHDSAACEAAGCHCFCKSAATCHCNRLSRGIFGTQTHRSCASCIPVCVCVCVLPTYSNTSFFCPKRIAPLFGFLSYKLLICHHSSQLTDYNRIKVAPLARHAFSQRALERQALQ